MTKIILICHIKIRFMHSRSSWLMLFPQPGLIILNAWYGKFVTDNSRKHERAKVIDVTVPLQCLVKDSKLILTEASKVRLSNSGNTSSDIFNPFMRYLLVCDYSVSRTYVCCGVTNTLRDDSVRCWRVTCIIFPVRTPWLLRPLCGGGEEPEGAVSVPRSHASSLVRRHGATQDTKAMWVPETAYPNGMCCLTCSCGASYNISGNILSAAIFPCQSAALSLNSLLLSPAVQLTGLTQTHRSSSTDQKDSSLSDGGTCFRHNTDSSPCYSDIVHLSLVFIFI